MKKTTLKILLPIVFILFANQLKAQWNDLGGNNITGLKYLGSNGVSTVPLKLKTIETGANALPIDFYTNNTYNMSLQTSGDLSLVNLTTGFKINNQYVLWHNGITSNIYLGVNPFTKYITGQYNTMIGYHTNLSNPSLFNVTCIGANATAGLSNSIILGDSNINVGIHTIAPLYTLHVQGTIAAQNIIILKENNKIENFNETIIDMQNEIALLKKEISKMKEQLSTAKN